MVGRHIATDRGSALISEVLSSWPCAIKHFHRSSAVDAGGASEVEPRLTKDTILVPIKIGPTRSLLSKCRTLTSQHVRDDNPDPVWICVEACDPLDRCTTEETFQAWVWISPTPPGQQDCHARARAKSSEGPIKHPGSTMRRGIFLEFEK